MSNPIYRPEPNGVVVLSFQVVASGKLCQDKEFFFGPDSEVSGSVYLDGLVSDAEESNLFDNGTHEIVMHPAWRGDDINPHEYDDTTVLKRVRFRIEKITKLTFLD